MTPREIAVELRRLAAERAAAAEAPAASSARYQLAAEADALGEAADVLAPDRGSA